MSQKKGKASKSENLSSDTKMYFDELKAELQDLKDSYLRPILQMYQNIDGALKKMKTEVNKNCENITRNANDILNLRKE